MTDPICEMCPLVRNCPKCMFRGGIQEPPPTDEES